MKHIELSLNPLLVNTSFLPKVKNIEIENKQSDYDILHTYIDSINTHNFESVQRLLADDAEFIFTDKTCSTMESIRSYFNNAWDELLNEKYIATDVNVLKGATNTRIFTYKFIYSGINKRGILIEGCGKATNVFVNMDGKWKLLHEHLSKFE